MRRLPSKGGISMQYLTYEQYLQMGGALEEAAFAPLQARAQACIDALTHRRMAGETSARPCATRAAFALVEAMRAQEEHAGRCVATMANDGLSVTYADGGEPSAIYARIVREHLSGQTTPQGVSVLYAGVDA